MKRLSAKNKIVILLIVWLILVGLMFVYFFRILDTKNQRTLDSMSTKLQNVALLKAQNESYKQAQKDLQKLAEQTYQTDDFFNRDISLVKEIETLENLSQTLSVHMKLSGVSGTTNTASKAKTVTPIVVIPYGISLNGDLKRVVDFIETLENLGFITNLSTVSVTVGEKGTVNANLGANFYLRK